MPKKHQVQLIRPFAGSQAGHLLIRTMQVQKRSDHDSEACPPSQSEATEDSEVFCRDVSTNLWYKASVIGRRKDGSLEMEWSTPFEGRIVVTADDIRSDDTGLVATDDNPPTEWQERCTSSQHSSVQVNRPPLEESEGPR